MLEVLYICDKFILLSFNFIVCVCVRVRVRVRACVRACVRYRV